jgi:hypothetical protein
MAVGKVTNTILDPGLNLASPGPSAVVNMGCSSAGTVGTLYSFSRVSDIVGTLGQGPLPEQLAHQLLVSGGPVYGMRMTTATAGACGVFTPVRIGTSTGTITVAGNANDSYSVRIEITATGTTGAGVFRYSLDGGNTFSENITIPSGGTYVLTNTGLTLTFVPGAGATYFQVGDVFTATATAPVYDATGLAAAFTSLFAQPLLYAAVSLAGASATGTAAATLAAALATQMTAGETSLRYMRAIIDSGSIDTAANVKTAFASFSSTRVNKVYGLCTMTSAKPFPGWAVLPNRPAVAPVTARAAASLISTSLGRFASGALPGVTAITHDEGKLQTMDSAKFTTLTTYLGESGIFITDGLLSAPTGSDFQLWQYGRVVDEACRVVTETVRWFINAGLRTATGGKLDPREAERIETKVNKALRTALLDPQNAEGNPGHASAARYTVDREFNVLSSRKLQGSVAIRPLGYPSEILTTIGLTTN